MDMEALVLQSQAAYKGFEERGMAVLRAQRERPVHPLATVLRLVDLFPQFAAQLKREGASDYQAHFGRGSRSDLLVRAHAKACRRR